jgi:hypothetical protein
MYNGVTNYMWVFRFSATISKQKEEREVTLDLEQWIQWSDLDELQLR